MPRLRQVPRSADNPRIVTVMYDMLFGPDRDPVAEPGTATGTPGDWWTVFALVPDVLKHAVDGFAPLPEPDPAARPAAAGARPDPRRMGPGQPVRVLAALQVVPGARHVRGEDRRHPAWQVADCFTPASGRCWPTPTPSCSTAGGWPTTCSPRCTRHLSDEEILELTYITALYDMHAVMSRALRTEFDDRDEPIVEVIERRRRRRPTTWARPSAARSRAEARSPAGQGMRSWAPPVIGGRSSGLTGPAAAAQTAGMALTMRLAAVALPPPAAPGSPGFGAVHGHLEVRVAR